MFLEIVIWAGSWWNAALSCASPLWCCVWNFTADNPYKKQKTILFFMNIARIFHPGPVIWPLHRRTPLRTNLIQKTCFHFQPFRGLLVSPASFLRCHASFQQGNIWTVLDRDHTCAHQQRKITTQPSIGSYLESNLGYRNNWRSFEKGGCKYTKV